MKIPIKIALLPGDGIGLEVSEAATPIFAALNLPVTLTQGDIGWSCWQNEGMAIPERTWQLINESDTILLGAITSKPLREAQKELAPKFQNTQMKYISPIILLRQKLDLYANVRPCFSIKKESRPFNFCVIRENTEGLYAGFDYSPPPEPIINLLSQTPHWQNTPAHEMSCALRLQSKKGLTRLFQFAFEYADAHQMQRVTFADKPNVLRLSGDFAREIFESAAAQFPHIEADILNVDAVALWLIRRPEEFGVVVSENMFGDILSDVGAGVMGGLGLAPSANIGRKQCYFEPVHGSAPRIKPNQANPCAFFLTVSMLLDHFTYKQEAALIRESVRAVINKGRFVTYDLGGTSSTKDMANAIIDQCLDAIHPQNKAQKEADPLITQLQQLKTFSSPEISDALDALGIEGALLHIKPLVPGIKLIGPAYTVQYRTYENKTKTFNQAANYIDAVPKNSVIVIDNQGRIDCTAWGSILTQMAELHHIAGTIVHGAVRDIDFIKASTYPVFCTGTYMRSGKNRIQKKEEQNTLVINGVTINPGDIIFADDHGVLVLARKQLADILEKAKNIQITEQNIITAIKNGSSLEQARTDYHYDKPWLGAKKHESTY